MNEIEHLLTILSEECAELAKCAAKAQRFGLNDIEPGLTETNADRIMAEFHDVLAAMEMLSDSVPGMGDLGVYASPRVRDAIYAKVEKVQKWMNYSREQGTLT